MAADDIVTLCGFSTQEAYKIMATPLPPECYKPVPGGAGLTDIDPAARDVVLNHVFGPCGVGWCYDYGQIEVEAVTRKGGSEAFRAFIPRLELRILWLVDGERVWSEPIPVAGSSTNQEAGYAAKGAATSAISGAASHLGFQQFVYQGKLTERTAFRAYAKYGPHPFEAAIRSAMLPDQSAADGEVESDRVDHRQSGSAGDRASALQTGTIKRLLKDLGYENRADEGLADNGLAPLEQLTRRQAGAAIDRLRKALAEPQQAGSSPAAGQLVQIYNLLERLGYSGESARQALTLRGYDPDGLTAEQVEALIARLAAQVDAHKEAQQRAA